MKRPRAILMMAVSSGKQAAADKQSMPEQDERLHEVAAQRGWDIADIILVPGFSRVFYTYREFAEAALTEGISAPMRMFDHWHKRDFDVFACASGDRFGREQSIFAEVVGRTIDAGAIVFTLRDGEINASNRRMYVSMGGYQASVEIDELVRRHRFGMAKKARRGLPTSNWGHIYSHTVSGQGEDARTVVNEPARRLFADIAELLLVGVSWRQMPDLLAQRGHYRASERNLSASTLRKWLMHPTLWGNSAQHFQDIDRFSVARGFWVFDPDEPAPDYVTVHYGTHPPMYEGALAECVKAELRRRFNAGESKPQPRRKFSSLVVCDECHYACNYKQDGGWLGVHCVSRRQVDLATHCPNNRYVNEKKLIAFADEMFRAIVESGDWTALMGERQRDDTADKLAAVSLELETLKHQSGELMMERATLPNFHREKFKQLMDDMAARGETLQAEYERLKQEARNSVPDPAQLIALAEFAKLPLGGLWGLPDAEINQWVARIVGRYRFVINNGSVIGMSNQPRKFHLPTRN